MTRTRYRSLVVVTRFLLLGALALLAGGRASAQIPPPYLPVNVGNAPIYAGIMPQITPPIPAPPETAAASRLAARLALTPASARPGESVSLQISVTNPGETAVPPLTLRLALPDGLTLDGAAAWPLDGLAPGASRQYTRTVTVAPAATAASLTLRLDGENEAGEPVLAAWGTLWLAQPDITPTITATTGLTPTLSGAQTAANDPLRPPDPGGWVFRPIEPVPALFAGAASYNYPLETPPARNGLGPQLRLAYNSRTTDGQVGWFDSNRYGEGWSLEGIPFITRQNAHYCEGQLANQASICFGDKFRLFLNGGGYDLAWAGGCGAGCVLYRAEDAPGLRVEYYPAGAANKSGSWWLARQPDGVVYRFGYYEDAEQTLVRACTAPDNCGEAVYRWYLDRQEDGSGNQMVILYGRARASGGFWGCITPDSCREVDVWPELIRYNNVAANPDRNNRNDWMAEVDLQWAGLRDRAVNGGWPIFRVQNYLSGVQINTRNQSGVWWGKWRYQIGQWEIPCPGGSGVYCPNNSIRRVLDRIQRVESSGAVWPAVTFSYANRETGAASYCTQWGDAGCLPGATQTVHFTYPYLARVDNGYGGVYEFSYEDTGGQVNGARSWRVTGLKVWDGVNAVYGQTPPAREQTFVYAGECYDRYGGCYRGPGEQSYKLVGHQYVTVTTYDYAGGTRRFLERTGYEFRVAANGGGRLLLGREMVRTAYLDEAGTTLAGRTFSFWAQGGEQCPTDGFGEAWACLYEQQRETWQDGNVAYMVRERYFYEPGRQGGRQWGFRTTTYLYGADGERYRQEITGYVTNTGAEWRAAPWFAGVWNTNWGVERLTIYLYGNHNDPNNQLLARGDQLTWERAVINDGCAGGSGIYRTADKRYGYNSYGLLTAVWTPPDYGRLTAQCSAPYDWFPAGDLGRPWGNAAEAGYTGDGLLILWTENELNQRTNYKYEGGPEALYPWQVTAVTDPNNLTTRYRYDNLGRLQTVIGPAASAASPSLSYSYDLSGPVRITETAWPNEGTACAARRKRVTTAWGGRWKAGRLTRRGTKGAAG